MFILLTDCHTGGVQKTKYDYIIIQISLLDLITVKNKYRDMFENRLIEGVSEVLFNSRFGFSPASQACEDCCGDDYRIDLYSDINLINDISKGYCLYYINFNMDEFEKILDTIEVEYIFLNESDYDSGIQHHNDILKKYKDTNRENKYMKTDCKNIIININKLYEITLLNIKKELNNNKLTKEYIRSNLPQDIIDDLDDILLITSNM